jgi:hypothetical protein
MKPSALTFNVRTAHCLSIIDKRCALLSLLYSILRLLYVSASMCHLQGASYVLTHLLSVHLTFCEMGKRAMPGNPWEPSNKPIPFRISNCGNKSSFTRIYVRIVSNGRYMSWVTTCHFYSTLLTLRLSQSNLCVFDSVKHKGCAEAQTDNEQTVC